jgi:hypothetical protein
MASAPDSNLYKFCKESFDGRRLSSARFVAEGGSDVGLETHVVMPKLPDDSASQLLSALKVGTPLPLREVIHQALMSHRANNLRGYPDPLATCLTQFGDQAEAPLFSALADQVALLSEEVNLKPIAPLPGKESGSASFYRLNLLPLDLMLCVLRLRFQVLGHRGDLQHVLEGVVIEADPELEHQERGLQAIVAPLIRLGEVKKDMRRLCDYFNHVALNFGQQFQELEAEEGVTGLEFSAWIYNRLLSLIPLVPYCVIASMKLDLVNRPLLDEYVKVGNGVSIEVLCNFRFTTRWPETAGSGSVTLLNLDGCGTSPWNTDT